MNQQIKYNYDNARQMNIKIKVALKLARDKMVKKWNKKMGILQRDKYRKNGPRVGMKVLYIPNKDQASKKKGKKCWLPVTGYAVISKLGNYGSVVVSDINGNILENRLTINDIKLIDDRSLEEEHKKPIDNNIQIEKDDNYEDESTYVFFTTEFLVSEILDITQKNRDSSDDTISKLWNIVATEYADVIYSPITDVIYQNNPDLRDKIDNIPEGKIYVKIISNGNNHWSSCYCLPNEYSIIIDSIYSDIKNIDVSMLDEINDCCPIIQKQDCRKGIFYINMLQNNVKQPYGSNTCGLFTIIYLINIALGLKEMKNSNNGCIIWDQIKILTLFSYICGDSFGSEKQIRQKLFDMLRSETLQSFGMVKLNSFAKLKACNKKASCWICCKPKDCENIRYDIDKVHEYKCCEGYKMHLKCARLHCKHV